MDWKKIIDDLIAAGMTQAEIAAECGGVQSSVSALRRGETKSPNFDFGNRLLHLHEARSAGKPARIPDQSLGVAV